MIQQVEMTREQKKKMYMKCTKSELAEMLIECNEILSKQHHVVIVNPQPVIEPIMQPFFPNYPPYYTTCGDLSVSTTTN